METQPVSGVKNEQDAPSGVPNLVEESALSQNLRDDPLLRFVMKWWRQILVAVVALAAVTYARYQFASVRESAMGMSSDLFSKVQSDYSGLLSGQREVETAKHELEELANEKDAVKKEVAQKKLELAQAALADHKRVLNQSLNSLADSRPPYSQLAPLYRALLASAEGDKEALKSLGDPFAWISVRDLTSTERLSRELAALVVARNWLDDTAQYSEGRKILSSLAREGVYSAVPAAISLARVSSTSEEKSEVLAILKALIARDPEQSEVVTPEIKRLEPANT